MLSRYLIYKYNDMAYFFVEALSRYHSSLYFVGYLNYKDSVVYFSEPIFSVAVYFLSRYIDPVALVNLIILFFLTLSLIFSYNLFFLITKSREISFVFSLTYSFSPYFLFRVISFTPPLLAIFIFPLLLCLLINKVKSIYLGMFVSFALLISNYYGFFSLVIVMLWNVSEIFISSKSFLDKLKSVFVRTVVFLIPILLLVFLLFSKILLANVPVFGNYKAKTADSNLTYRPIEDFYNLSFRPWYFVLPPKSSLLFGKISQNVYKTISNSNYYLANDYSEEEMGGVFLGWHFILGVVVVLVLLVKKKYSVLFPQHTHLTLRIFFIILGILLISFPPSFSIGGITIYTPSYLVYYITPIFRVLVRWSVVIFLLVLVINSLLVCKLYSKIQNGYMRIIFLILFLFLNILIFAVRLPVVDLKRPPSGALFLKNVSDKPFGYAVYPNGEYSHIFWILVHKKYLVNPLGFVNKQTGFVANDFTDKLLTEDANLLLKKADARYILYYPRLVSDNRLQEITILNPKITKKGDIRAFFESHFGFPVLEDSDVVIFKVV